MKRKIPEAAVALCKCTTCHQLFGIRLEKTSSNTWKQDWAFPVQENCAKHEGYGTVMVKGNVEITDDYPGCPHCGNKGIFICSCGKTNAMERDYNPSKTFRCEWCGNESTLGEYDGSGFESGDDR